MECERVRNTLFEGKMVPSKFLIFFLSCFLLSNFVIARKELALETTEEEHHYHTLQLSSLLPSATCNPSPKGDKKKGSLDVVHIHGPCSKFSEEVVRPTVEEIFAHDQLRVASIRARSTFNKGKKDALGSKLTLPANSGSTIGSANYIVTVGLGTPKKDMSLIFDTGSHLTWTQCQPCAGSCYSQQDPIFAPSASTTYKNISCPSTECSGVASGTGDPRCLSSTCVYQTAYGDGSFTEGFYATEKLTLTSNDIIDHFYFGCGQNNQGLFKGAAGLIGLGRDKLSLASQAANKYGKVFSYCLPSSASSTGYLTFGSSGVASGVTYTPLSTSPGDLYGLDLNSIYVGGTKLPISPSVFSKSGMIIDSGTVITRLPPTAYSALSKEFRAQMTKYPMNKPSGGIFDTCYDFSNYTRVSIPKISILWAGNTKLDIAPQGVLYANNISNVCLAFAPNDNDSDTGILGNVQQKTIQVVYDVNAGKVGFASGGCA